MGDPRRSAALRTVKGDMRKVAYFDCFAGVSGDMILGALLDAGLRLDALRGALRGLPLRGWRLEARRVRREGLAGTRASVTIVAGAGKTLHGLEPILRLVRRSRLPAPVRRSAEETFHLLARAESRVHGVRLAEAHFHEVGAVDSVVDVLGALAGLQLLGVDEVRASALPWNGGMVRCAHGLLPVPAPATVELLRGLPVAPHPSPGEMVTPTGIAILRAVAAGFGACPAMTVVRVGYGAGEKRFHGVPNLLRLVLGEAEGGDGAGVVTVLETEIDDMPPSRYDHLSRLLFEAGALDVFMTPVLMKKNRPGQLLTALISPGLADTAAEIVLRESTTLGVRMREERRVTLPRRIVEVKTRFGRVRVKLARRPGGRVTAAPEHDDCAALAARTGAPLDEVANEARKAAARRAGRRRGAKEERGARLWSR